MKTRIGISARSGFGAYGPEAPIPSSKLQRNPTLEIKHRAGMNRGPSPEPRQGFRQHAEFRFGAIGAWCLELLQSVEPGTWCLVILLTCFAAPSARSAATLTTLYSFNGPEGANPVGGLVLGADGSFYGTTGYGGTGFTGRSETGKGTVCKIARDGTVTNLHLFGGGDDGVWPMAGLVQGSDGNLYGTTFWRLDQLGHDVRYHSLGRVRRSDFVRGRGACVRPRPWPRWQFL